LSGLRAAQRADTGQTGGRCGKLLNETATGHEVPPEVLTS
jgi:hypothetical protein